MLYNHSFRNRRIRIDDAIATIAIECDDSRANFGGRGVRPFLRSVGRTGRSGKNIPASSHVCRKLKFEDAEKMLIYLFFVGFIIYVIVDIYYIACIFCAFLYTIFATYSVDGLARSVAWYSTLAGEYPIF